MCYELIYYYYDMGHAQVVDKDFKDIDIIAFRRMNQMDISGNVITAEENLSSLKVTSFLSLFLSLSLPLSEIFFM